MTKFFCYNFSKLPLKSCSGERRLHPQRPQSVFEEDEAEEATEKSPSKCCTGYTYFVQLNWLWKVEFLSLPISKYWNRTTTLIPFLRAIWNFCNFIHSYFMDRFEFLFERTSYLKKKSNPGTSLQWYKSIKRTDESVSQWVSVLILSCSREKASNDFFNDPSSRRFPTGLHTGVYIFLFNPMQKYGK